MPLNDNSKISETQSYIANTKLSSLKFKNRDIRNTKRQLYVNKAHSHNNISISMPKICNSTIVEPLSPFLTVA